MMDQQNVCPQCSTPAAPGASFCTKCGAALAAPAQPAPAPAQPAGDRVQMQEGPQATPSQAGAQPAPSATGPAYTPPQPAQPDTAQQGQPYHQAQGQPQQQPYPPQQGQPYQAQQPQGQPQQGQPYQPQQGQPNPVQGPAYQPPNPTPSPYPPAPKSRMAAGLLGIFLGALGIHNFYLGFTNKALVQLLVSVCTCGIGAFPMWIWALVEGIQILTGTIATDARGIPLSE